MRRAFATLHRWLGLFSALFLFIAGLTGAIIAWDHELDAWLNPQLFVAHTRFERAIRPEQALALLDRVERDDPRLSIRYAPLALAPGQALQISTAPRVDPATARSFVLDFDQLALDPVSGRVQGRRLWGEVSLARENLLPFLYKLHYTLHLPDVREVEAGKLWMGLVAMVWALDCLIALWISFPSRKVWRKSFSFRFNTGSAKVIFDLHRSGGVWTWLFLLTLAVTGVSMNLREPVMRPLVALFSPLSPSPFARAKPVAPTSLPGVTRAEAVRRARDEAKLRGIHGAPGGIFYSAELGAYGVGFFAPGGEHGDGGLGNPWIYLDAHDGHLFGSEIPGRGSAGDLFLQAQFPLHSGRIVGVAGRVLVSLLGLIVALLSATGVLLWARRRAREHARLRVRTALPIPSAE